MPSSRTHSHSYSQFKPLTYTALQLLYLLSHTLIAALCTNLKHLDPEEKSSHQSTCTIT